MGETFKYISPWADEQPTDPQARKKADDAFKKLAMRFLVDPQQKPATTEGNVEATKKLNATLEVYFSLCVRAAADGVKGDEAEKFVKEGLIAGGLIDTSDPAKVAEEFTIISEGYELNRPYWDEKLGRSKEI